MGEQHTNTGDPTVAEGARRWRVSRACVQRMCADGRLGGAYRLDLGKRYVWRIPLAAVQRRELLPPAVVVSAPADGRRAVDAATLAALGDDARWVR